MASRAMGYGQSISQSSGHGERAKTMTQHPVSSNAQKQLNGKENQAPRNLTPAAPIQPQRSGTSQIHEKVRRNEKHGQAFQTFVAAAEQRRIQRKELNTRNKVWDETTAKCQARIQALDRERAALLQKMNSIEAAKSSYNRHYGVQVSGERDEAARRAWEAYLNLETDRLEV